MTKLLKIAFALLVVCADFGAPPSVHAAPVIHWTNGSNQDGSTSLNNTGSFTTTFRSGNDVTATLLTGVANGTFIDNFGGATPGNNPSYLTTFMGTTAMGTGDGVAGHMRFLGMTAAATGSLQFDFAQPITSADRLLLVDIDASEQYRIDAYALVGSSYVPLSLLGWTHQDFSGQSGITPDSRWATWNPSTGMLAATSNSLNEPLSVLTPDQPVSRLVITKTNGAGFYTGFQVIEVGLTGDYNNDGHVDAADYVVWRKFNNTATTLPNDSTPGTDDTDFAVWQSNFGESSGTGSTLSSHLEAAVPEPATLILLIIGAAYGCLRRRWTI